MTESTITPVAEAFASGSDIAPIVAKIEAVIGDVPRTHALIALTSIMLLMQYPELTNDQLYEGVKDISRFTCLWLAGAEGSDNEPIDKSKMN